MGRFVATMVAVVFALFSVCICNIRGVCQAPAPAPTAEGSGSTAVSSGVPGATPAGASLSLADVVRIAVGNNSSLVAARQRLEIAQELIEQVNAQGRPQIGISADDVDTNYKTYPPYLSFPAVPNLTLPGAAAIPTVVDAAGSFPTAFLGASGAAGSSGAGVNAPGINEPGAAPNAATPSAPMNAPSSSGTDSSPAAPTGGAAAPSSAPGPSPSGATPSSSSETDAPAAAATIPAIVADYLTDSTSLGASASTYSVSSFSRPGSSLPQALISPSSSSAPGDVRVAGGSGAVGDALSMSGGDVADSNGESVSAAQQPMQASGGTPVPPERNNNAAARVAVTQLIDIFGLLPAARGVQNDYRDFYALDFERLQNETALAAKNLFFNLLLAQAQVDTEQQQVDYATENVRITQDRFTQGIVSNFDVLTAQTALSTAQQQLTAADDQRDLAQASLSYLLGTNPDVPLVLTTPDLPPLDQPVDLAQSMQTALADRPEIQQAKSNINEARGLVKLAGAGLLPTVGISGSAFATNGASSAIPQKYAELVAELSAPLDDGGATRSRVRSSQIVVQSQALILQQLQQSVGLEVRQAVVNIRNAQSQVASAQTGVTEANEALRLARERYQAGLGTFLDVLNALAQLAATRTNLSTAEYFYQSSLAQLVRAMGGR